MPASGICQFPICWYSHLLPLHLFNLQGSCLSIPFILSTPFIAFVISGYFRLFCLTLYKYTLELFSSVFAPFYACTQFVEHITTQSQDVILNRTSRLTPCTANTALLSAGLCSPGRSLCSCVLLPYRFLKCGLSDAPPGTDHLTGSWQPLPCL